MASTLKVSNRSAKKPIKKLPTSIEITPKTTVQDVKDKLAFQAGGMDPNRLGLFDSKNKILKDRKALIASQKEISDAGEIFVKDLGPQIQWRTVFLIEYVGPILIHFLVPALRSTIYNTFPYSLSTSQKLSIAMITLHFIKREYETLFIHKFSAASMPARNIFKNSFHYWVLSGANLAYWIYSPTSYTAQTSPTIQYLDIAGVILYIFGEVSNLLTHITLSNLRSPGGTERGIPQGYGFNLVTCPNYMFETIAWIGVLLVTKSASTVLFLVVAFVQMYVWAVKKERALRKEFPDRYKKKRSVILPGLL